MANFQYHRVIPQGQRSNIRKAKKNAGDERVINGKDNCEKSVVKL